MAEKIFFYLWMIERSFRSLSARELLRIILFLLKNPKNLGLLTIRVLCRSPFYGLWVLHHRSLLQKILSDRKLLKIPEKYFFLFKKSKNLGAPKCLLAVRYL